MNKIHFITGKGGVGKTFHSLALSQHLATQEPHENILIIEVQNTQHCLKQLKVDLKPTGNTITTLNNNLHYCYLDFNKCFQEYLSLMLSLGQNQKLLGKLTSTIRNEFAQKIIKNKAINSFIHACPGLKPTSLLGKIYFEYTLNKWKHIIVDCPATGHFKQLISSTMAMKELFPIGPIHRQAKAIENVLRNDSEISIISLAEELPLKEAHELKQELKEKFSLNSEIKINKHEHSSLSLDNSTELPLDLKNEILKKNNQRSLLEAFINNHSLTKLQCFPHLTMKEINGFKNSLDRHWKFSS